MKELKLEINKNCWLTKYIYDNPEGTTYLPDNIYLTYIEHSPDHWYSDTETDIELDATTIHNLKTFLGEDDQDAPSESENISWNGDE